MGSPLFGVLCKSFGHASWSKCLRASDVPVQHSTVHFVLALLTACPSPLRYCLYGNSLWKGQTSRTSKFPMRVLHGLLMCTSINAHAHYVYPLVSVCFMWMLPPATPILFHFFPKLCSHCRVSGSLIYLVPRMSQFCVRCSA